MMLAGVLVVFTLSGERADAQNTFDYDGGVWTSADSWSGEPENQFPGLSGRAGNSGNGSIDDIAKLGAASGHVLRINMSNSSTSANGSLTLGTIWFLNTTLQDLQIDNLSNSLNGYLGLTGSTIGGEANTILASTSGHTLTLEKTGPNAMTLELRLANETANTVQINGTGNIVITADVHDAADTDAGALVLTGIGTGWLELSGNNSYAGGTVIDAGTLLTSSAGALGSGPVSIGGGSGTATLMVAPDIQLDVPQLTLDVGAHLAFNLNGAPGAAPILAGDQFGTGIYSVDIHDEGGLLPGVHTLMVADAWEATGFELASIHPELQGSYLTWSDGTLSLTVIPEARTFFLMCMGAACLLARRLGRARAV